MSSKKKQWQSDKGHSYDNFGHEFEKEKRRHERRREMKRRSREEPEEHHRRSFRDYDPLEDLEEEREDFV